MQQEGESFSNFLRNIKEKVKSCEFDQYPGLEDELVRDRIVFGVFDNGLRNSLLTKEDLTLESAVDICNSYEYAKHTKTFKGKCNEGKSETEMNDSDNNKEDFNSNIETCETNFTAATIPRDGSKSGAKNYECKICGKFFLYPYFLKRHQVIHTGKKNHECNICGKHYARADNLKNHQITVHSEVKNYQCNICQKSFTEAGSLRKHLLIHTGEKPHKCHICGKGFTESRNLKTHLVFHSGVKSHECNFCDKRFSLKGDLKKHQKRAHSTVEKQSQGSKESITQSSSFKTDVEMCKEVETTDVR